MWLALDIGNSASKAGLFEGRHLRRAARFFVAPGAPPDAWADALREALGPDLPRFARAGIASVVPAAIPAVRRALGEVLEETAGCPVCLITHRLRLPFALAYETPQTLGADRLAAAAAAWTRYGAARRTRPARSVIALDAGTAITYEVVDAGGTYRGGAIAPGPRLLRQALQRGTAQLPSVPLDVPPRPDGRSTREALQSGLMHGFLDAAAGMLRRLSRTLGGAPVVVATGGWSGLLAERLSLIDHAEPHLVLHGIRALMALNEKGGEGEREKE